MSVILRFSYILAIEDNADLYLIYQPFPSDPTLYWRQCNEFAKSAQLWSRWVSSTVFYPLFFANCFLPTASKNYYADPQ